MDRTDDGTCGPEQWWRPWSKIPPHDDAKAVLGALRLGWSVAEMRGRNRPGGPPGDGSGMPDQDDHPLPLRIERSPTELRIEAQSVVTALARQLHVDAAGGGASFGATLDGRAMLLYHSRAPKASAALQAAMDLLENRADGAPDVPAAVLTQLQTGLAAQQAVVSDRQQGVTTAQQQLAQAQQQLTDEQGRRADGAAGAERAVTEATAALELMRAAAASEQTGLSALTQAIAALQPAQGGAAQSTAETAAAVIGQGQQQIAAAAEQAWAGLAELIWRFDAHAQDGLTAVSETQAIGYQLGRGLAETYWALDPANGDGSMGWGFVLGRPRCAELTRLIGRLAVYMNQYTAPGIAGSLEVWKDVAATPAWRGEPGKADSALYRQTRRWFELIILGQDPTTLIEPGAIFRDYRTVGRALRFFWPQLAALVIGLAFLGALLVFVGIGGSGLQKALSGIVAGVGLSLAGLTATAKNSAQAMGKRLKQDAYTDLVALAVQTAPPAPHKSDIRKAIARRKLTAATPN